MEPVVIGISHRTAPVEVREKAALPGELARRLLRALHAEKAFDEVLILDTCNRTEFLVVPNGPGDPLECILAHVARLKETSDLPAASAFYRHGGLDAVRHLFSVAAGLDSQIVGEHEIVAQLKAAYRLALEERTARFLLNKLMHWTFRVAKRVRTETDIGAGSTSVAQAAVDLAGQVFTQLAGKTVLLVGAGATIEAAARTLVRPGLREVIVANRTLSRAQELADALAAGRLAGDGEADEPITCPALLRLLGLMGAPPRPAGVRVPARAIELAGIGEAIARADLVLCSTGAPEPVLTYDALAGAIRRRRDLLLIVDIAVPRDVDPRLGRLPNVFLHNINDLDKVVAATLDRRRREAPKARAIIEHEAGRFAAWRGSLDAAETIRQLRQWFGQLQQEQMERYGRKLEAGARQAAEAFAQGLLNKVLHQPTTFLRGLSQEPASEQLPAIEAVRRMFALDAMDETTTLREDE